MKNTPSTSFIGSDGEPGTLRPAVMPVDGDHVRGAKPVEPSLSQQLKDAGWIEYISSSGVCTYRHPGFEAIGRDIEQRRERIARKLEI